MCKKIFIVLMLSVFLFGFGTSVFASADIELPSKLRALLDIFINPDVARPDNLTLTLYGKQMTIIDFSYFEQHRETIFWLIRAFFYPFLVLFWYDNVLLFTRGFRYTSPIHFFGKDVSGQIYFDFNDKK